MSWWMIVLIVLAALFLLSCIPLGVDAAYGDGGPVVKILAGPLKLQVLPAKKKQKKKKKPKKKKKAAEKKPGEKKKNPILAGGLDGILALVELLQQTLGKFRRKLTVELLELYVTFGAKDAAAAAIGYGKAWAVIGGLTPALDGLFNIKKRDVHPILDYNEKSLKCTAHLILTITLGRLLGLGLFAGFGFLKIMNENKKAVQKNESST
jgi:hypothetical protein